MNKSERKQVAHALGALHSDARYAAAALATIQRSANAKTAAEVSEVIESHPGIKQHLVRMNGCYIPRAAQ